MGTIWNTVVCTRNKDSKIDLAIPVMQLNDTWKNLSKEIFIYTFRKLRLFLVIFYNFETGLLHWTSTSKYTQRRSFDFESWLDSDFVPLFLYCRKTIWIVDLVAMILLRCYDISNVNNMYIQVLIFSVQLKSLKKLCPGS